MEKELNEYLGKIERYLKPMAVSERVDIVKEIKNADINEEQLRSTVNKVYDKLEEMGIGKKEVKGILQKLIELAKNILE